MQSCFRPKVLGDILTSVLPVTDLGLDAGCVFEKSVLFSLNVHHHRFNVGLSVQTMSKE